MGDQFGLKTRVALRPASEEDLGFLFQVYASTRAEEMEATGWPDDARERFLQMQFDLQQKHYRAHYPGADFQVIWDDARPIGRLYVHRTASEIRIMDIALLPERRRQGIGTELLLTLIGESEATGIPLTLHVEGNHPIRAYYARLGFVPGELRGIYYFMERRPGVLAGK